MASNKISRLKNNNLLKIVVIVVSSIVLIILLINIVFYKKIQNFQSYVELRQNAENKQEFDKNFQKMTDWIKDYKDTHPGATDEEASQAFIKALETN
jgi:predicted PurR-regulated permease PerM